ncbi:MAG: hypothetical protein K9N48_00930, partial [Verrucomicrobia bacterium]|nr:hypothetical protein [Verrucomicrobiota bacterium]
EHVRLHIKRCINSRDGLTANYRVRNRRTGRVAYLMEHRQAIKSETGLVLGYECVWLNITRQTIAEKRLTSAAWKETLAVITMGLAHDFSNIMAGIHALSESFLSQVKENDPFYEGLTMIKRHSFLATQLVQRIMTLYRGKTGERNYHDLNEIVIDLKELSHKVIPRRIEMEMALEKRQLPLYVDAVEMRQVILNLALNAAEAMPMGGKLSFSTSVHDKNPRPKNIQGRFPRTPALCLEVRDTGCGISDRFLDLVFDPFFTTKTTHKGSGLGLYNARLFVEKHHGAISVSSKPGDGTSICMWLPEADFTEQERGMDDGETHRYKLLVAGQAGRFADAQAELYRENGMHVVTADNIDKARDLISFEDPAFSAVLILVESSNSKWLNFISEINAGDFSGKIITHIAGCNQDEIDATALGRSDLVITQDDSEKNVIDNMRNLFET